MSSFLLFFLLLVASASAGVLYSRNADGSFSVSSGSDDIPNEDLAKSNNENSVDESRHFVGSDVHHPMNVIHMSKFADVDVNGAQEPFDERIVHETIQLRDPDVSVVEKALIKDVVRIIMKNDEYMILLNHPTFPEIVTMVRSMLREPIQEILQHQLWSKVLAIREYYDNVFKPFNDPDAKATAMEFLNHLKKSSVDHQLAVSDTVELDKKVKELAFLLQEEEFDQKLSELEGMLSDSKHEYKRGRHVRKNAVDDIPEPTKFRPPTTLAPGRSTFGVMEMNNGNSNGGMKPVLKKSTDPLVYPTTLPPQRNESRIMKMNNENSDGSMKPVSNKMNNGNANGAMYPKFNNMENENVKNGNMNGSTRKFSWGSSEEIPIYQRGPAGRAPVMRKMSNADVDEPRYMVQNNDHFEVEKKVNEYLDFVLEPELNKTSNKKTNHGNVDSNKEIIGWMKVGNLNGSTGKVSMNSSEEVFTTTSAPGLSTFGVMEINNSNGGMKPVLKKSTDPLVYPTTLPPQRNESGMVEMNNDNAGGVLKAGIQKMNNGNANDAMNLKFSNVEIENTKNENMNGSTRKFSWGSSEEIPIYPRGPGGMKPVVRKMNNGDLDEPRYMVQNNDHSVEKKVIEYLDFVLDPELNKTSNKKTNHGSVDTNKEIIGWMKVGNLNGNTGKVSKNSSEEVFTTTSAPGLSTFGVMEMNNGNSDGSMKPVENVSEKMKHGNMDGRNRKNSKRSTEETPVYPTTLPPQRNASGLMKMNNEPVLKKSTNPPVYPATLPPKRNESGVVEMNNDNASGVMKPMLNKMNDGNANGAMNPVFKKMDNEKTKNENMNGNTTTVPESSSREEEREYPRRRSPRPYDSNQVYD